MTQGISPDVERRFKTMLDSKLAEQKEPQIKASTVSLVIKCLKDIVIGLFAAFGVLTALVVVSFATNNDEWINYWDDRTPNGIFIIHDYILNTYGPK